MDELPYALSEEDFVRMASAVRRVEGLPPRRDSQAFNRAAVEENAHTWIKVTSATGSTVTLGGGTVTGYAAVWGFFDASGTGFTWTTNVAWFMPAPGGGTPSVNQVFECRLLGADTSAVPIWGAVLAKPPLAQTNTTISNTSLTSTVFVSVASVSITPGTYLLKAEVGSTVTVQQTWLANISFTFQTSDGTNPFVTNSNPTRTSPGIDATHMQILQPGGTAGGSVSIIGQTTLMTFYQAINNCTISLLAAQGASGNASATYTVNGGVLTIIQLA